MTENAPSRVAIVTGGSRGIGRQAALRLAADGQAVVIAYAGRDAEANGVVREITATGGQAFAMRADVGDEAAVVALFDAAEREFGGIDVVVNAAGIMILAPLVDFDLNELDRMHRTNIRGVSWSASRPPGESAAAGRSSTSPPRRSSWRYRPTPRTRPARPRWTRSA